MAQRRSHQAVVEVAALLCFMTTLFYSAPVAVAFNRSTEKMLQEQINRIDGKVEQSHRLQTQVASDLGEIRRDVMTMTGQLEEFNERARLLSEQIDSMESSFAEMSQVYRSKVLERSAITDLRLERLRTDLQALTLESAAFYKLLEKKNNILSRTHKKMVGSIRTERGITRTAPPDAAKQVAPDDMYQYAYMAYREGRSSDALKGFEKYLRDYPKTTLSDNAAYWIGEVWYGDKKYKEAEKAFNYMAETYPTSVKAPAALLRSASAALERSDTGQAVDRFLLIINRYPEVSEALQARERLTILQPDALLQQDESADESATITEMPLATQP